jgi:hypothetical protein
LIGLYILGSVVNENLKDLKAYTMTGISILDKPKTTALKQQPEVEN